jgi:hypothetical protein
VPFALPDALFFTGIDWAAETHAEAHLGEHPDGAIFTSLPRSGQINRCSGSALSFALPGSLRAYGDHDRAP